MKRVKKFASLLLAVIMVLSLTTTAFAANEDGTAKSTLTINTVNDHTYKVYQLLKGEITNLQASGTGVVSNAEKGHNLKTDDVDAFMAAVKDLSNAELGDAAYGYINDVNDPKYTVVGDGHAVATPVEDGYYVVVDEYTGSATDDNATVSRYMVAVAGNTTITPKTETPDIDKKIIDTDANRPLDNTDSKVDTAAIGDVIEFEITGEVPNTEGYKYYYYVVKDTMSPGLFLQQGEFKVYIGANKEKQLTRDRDFYLYFDTNTNSFEMAFKDLKKMVDDKTVNVGDKITIEYKALVTEDAEIGNDPNTNTAKLQYSNNPSQSTQNDKEDKPGTPKPGTAVGEGPEKTTKTYVTELIIAKVDQNGNKLKNVQFTLSGTNLTEVIVETGTTFTKVAEGETGEYYKLKDTDTYTKTPPNNAAEGEEGYNADKYENPGKPEYIRTTTTTKVTTTPATGTGADKNVSGYVNDEGYLVFTGLNAGDYKLSETDKPDGYNAIPDIEFTITYDKDNGWQSSNSKINVNGKGALETIIENKAGIQLPSTGGMGTTIFYVLGSILLVGAVVLLVTKKRMSSER